MDPSVGNQRRKVNPSVCVCVVEVRVADRLFIRRNLGFAGCPVRLKLPELLSRDPASSVLSADDALLL